MGSTLDLCACGKCRCRHEQRSVPDAPVYQLRIFLKRNTRGHLATPLLITYIYFRCRLRRSLRFSLYMLTPHNIPPRSRILSRLSVFAAILHLPASNPCFSPLISHAVSCSYLRDVHEQRNFFLATHKQRISPGILHCFHNTVVLVDCRFATYLSVILITTISFYLSSSQCHLKTITIIYLNTFLLYPSLEEKSKNVCTVLYYLEYLSHPTT